MNSPSTRTINAFTVVEILLVIVIMAISAAIVVPMVGGRNDLTLSAATRKVVADLQYAQNLAIATRASVYVKFQTDQYDLCRLDGSTLTPMTHPVEKYPFSVRFGSGGDANLSRVSMATPSIASKNILGFDSLGMPFAFDGVLLTRTNLTSVSSLSMTCGSLTQQVLIEPYTGEITVP